MDRARWGGAIAVGTAALAVLILHAWSYRAFLADDALISLRYSKQLLAGHGLVWNPGERVEGYSNLLWVLGCSLVGGLGFDLVQAARALGFLGMATALVALVREHVRHGPSGLLPALTAALLLALAGPIAGWTFGGLEQPLLAALLAWSIVLCLPLLEREPETVGWRQLRVPGLLLGLLCWTRADAMVLALSLVSALVLTGGLRRPAIRMGMRLASLPLVFVLVQLIFRRAYYGLWVPNTALARVALTPERLERGLGYLWDGLPGQAPFLVATLVTCVARLRRRRQAAVTFGLERRVLFLLAPALVWCAYVAVIGGDTLHLHRHFVPVLVLLAFVVAEGVAAAAAARPMQTVARTMLGVGIGLGLAAQLALSLSDREKKRATTELWVQQSEIIGRFLARAFGAERALVAVDAAGGVPFWSDLPAVDMLGLNDAYLAQHPPADFGRGWPGHELGDGRYVLGRQPDLVLLCSPFGAEKACLRSGQELLQLPEFRNRYTLVTFEPQPATQRARIWVRRESERIGIRRLPDRVSVPGFLLNGNPRSVARFEGDRLGVTIDAQTPAWTAGLQLASGSWRLIVDASRSGVQVVVRRSNDGQVLVTSPMDASFELMQDTAVDVAVIAPADAADAPVHVGALTIARPHN